MQMIAAATGAAPIQPAEAEVGYEVRHLKPGSLALTCACRCIPTLFIQLTCGLQKILRTILAFYFHF